MAKIEKLQFPALEVTGTNYTAWVTNMELHLDFEEILGTIKDGNISTSHEKAKAVIFLRRHLDENLTHDYARTKDPLDLWKALKKRFDNQKKITLPMHSMSGKIYDFKILKKWKRTIPLY